MKQEIIPGMCYIIPFPVLRQTPKVEFHSIPEIDGGLSAITRVHHEAGAYSPKVEGMEGEHESRPWYFHPHQEDNLIVFEGTRLVDLYTTKHGKIEHFEVTSDKLIHNGKTIYEGPHIFGWHTNVFHRVESPNGSISENLATRKKGFDIKTNFNIYCLNPEKGESYIMREGHLDQPK